MKLEVQSYIARLRKKIAAAEAFLASLEESDEQPAMHGLAPRESAPPAEANGSATDEDNYGKNVKVVRATLEAAPRAFDVADIETLLSRKNTPLERGIISQTLSKMGKSGELEVVERGAGRRPSKYTVARRRPEPPNFHT